MKINEKGVMSGNLRNDTIEKHKAYRLVASLKSDSITKTQQRKKISNVLDKNTVKFKTRRYTNKQGEIVETKDINIVSLFHALLSPRNFTTTLCLKGVENLSLTKLYEDYMANNQGNANMEKKVSNIKRKSLSIPEAAGLMMGKQKSNESILNSRIGRGTMKCRINSSGKRFVPIKELIRLYSEKLLNEKIEAMGLTEHFAQQQNSIIDNVSDSIGLEATDVLSLKVAEAADLMTGIKQSNVGILNRSFKKGNLSCCESVNGVRHVVVESFIKNFNEKLSQEKIEAAGLMGQFARIRALLSEQKELDFTQNIKLSLPAKKKSRKTKGLPFTDITRKEFMRRVNHNIAQLANGNHNLEDYYFINQDLEDNSLCGSLQRGFDIIAATIIGGLAVFHNNGVDCYRLAAGKYEPVEVKLCELHTRGLFKGSQGGLFYGAKVTNENNRRTTIRTKINGTFGIHTDSIVKSKNITTALVLMDTNNVIIDAFEMHGDDVVDCLSINRNTGKKRTSTTRSIALSTFMDKGYQCNTSIPVYGYLKWENEQRERTDLPQVKKKKKKK